MPVEFRCAQCQKLLRVGDAAVGKKARCPDCGSIQEVPVDPTALNPSAKFPIESSAPLASPPSTATASTANGDSIVRYPISQYPNPFGSAPPHWTATTSAQAKCRSAGTGLVVVGGIFTAFHIGGAVLQVILAAGGVHDAEQFVLSFAVMLVGLIYSLVILIGGRKMQQLQSYRMAMTAAVLALVPCHPCFFVTLPVGIWSLIVLLDPQVRNAFR